MIRCKLEIGLVVTSVERKISECYNLNKKASERWGLDFVKIDKFFEDTLCLMTNKKSEQLSLALTAFNQSGELVNDVGFWKWLSQNYSGSLGTSEMIQNAATNKPQWMRTILQGKGYEWDFMQHNRMNPSKIFSRFDAGLSPTQPGVDILEYDVISGEVINAYQNKAYLSGNPLNLTHTPEDAIVVTNQENILNAQGQGYETESFMDSDDIMKMRERRYENALDGNVSTDFNFQNMSKMAVKAGVCGAIIGVTVETLKSYEMWQTGKISDEQYLNEILKSGANSGITSAATSAIMVPVSIGVTAAGVTQLVTIPISFVVVNAVHNLVDPIFKQGKYDELLKKATYYCSLNEFYENFIEVIEKASAEYLLYAKHIREQSNQFWEMQKEDEELTIALEKLYNMI